MKLLLNSQLSEFHGLDWSLKLNCYKQFENKSLGAVSLLREPILGYFLGFQTESGETALLLKFLTKTLEYDEVLSY